MTFPANFSDAQRAATRKAASLAGMEVLRVLNEPTAAAIAYGSGRRKNQRFAVFDLGGGTFDVTVLVVRENLYEVLATGGDSFLGGDDVDAALYRAERLMNPDAKVGVLLDVTPHSLRVATVGGFTRVLITKNSTIPAEGTQTFFVAKEDQECVTLRVCQGEDDHYDNCVPLGEVLLEGLPHGKRGEIGVQVDFTIDADGILQVSARDTQSQCAASARLSIIGLEESR